VTFAPHHPKTPLEHTSQWESIFSMENVFSYKVRTWGCAKINEEKENNEDKYCIHDLSCDIMFAKLKLVFSAKNSLQLRSGTQNAK
jgi:hypothetical protein